MAFLIAEGSVAGGQTTTSDGLFQARDDSVLMERLTAGYDDFRVQLRFTNLPVSGASIERVTEMEQTERFYYPQTHKTDGRYTLHNGPP